MLAISYQKQNKIFLIYYCLLVFVDSHLDLHIYLLYSLESRYGIRECCLFATSSFSCASKLSKYWEKLALGNTNDAQQLLIRAQEGCCQLERFVRDATAAGTMQNFDLQSAQSSLQSLERDLRTKRERALSIWTKLFPS